MQAPFTFVWASSLDPSKVALEITFQNHIFMLFGKFGLREPIAEVE